MDVTHFFKHMLDHKYKIKDLGQLRFFTGFEIARSKALFFNQRKYTLNVSGDKGLLASNPYVIPFDPNTKLSATDG